MLSPLLRGSVKVGGTFALLGLPIPSSLSSPLKHACLGRVFSPHSVLHPFDVARNPSPITHRHSETNCKALPSEILSQTQAFGAHRGVRMGWACPSCTFINNAGVSVCGMCSQPAAVAPSSAMAKWSCEACTFINMGETAFCEMCDNGRPTTNQPSTNTALLSVPQHATSFRPLRASVKAGQEGAHGKEEAPPPQSIVQLEPEVVATARAGSSGSTNPKSRKRKAKAEEVVILSEPDKGVEAPDAKAATNGNGEEPNNLLKNLHQERMRRMNGGASASGGSDTQQNKGVRSLSKEQMAAYVQAEGTWLEKPSSELTILSYNVWFREDLQLQGRMEAIGDIILQHRPHIVFFQEVTENIYNIFQQASWWKSYDCSVKPGVAATRAYFCMQLSKLPVVSFNRNPFRNSVMGRELCLADLDAGNGAKLLVATTHLESPCPAPPTWNQMFSPERVVQAKEAMAILEDSPNVIFGGDMNWDDKQDGPPPLPSGWFDAWLHLRPGQVGFTYDSKANPMLAGSRLQKRLDRIYCHLRDFEPVSIEMVGTAPIPDLTYLKEKKVKGQVQMLNLPVLPSDHFGLLLKVRPRSP